MKQPNSLGKNKPASTPHVPLASEEEMMNLLNLIAQILYIQKKILKQQKKQNLLIVQMMEMQGRIQGRKLIYKVDICNLLGFGPTKFYRVRHLFTSYMVGKKEYYYEDEVHNVIKALAIKS